MESPRRPPRPPIAFVSLPLLLLPLLLLSVATVVALFLHTDTNIAMLYSQCHARARLPALTHSALPSALATPLCFILSLFAEATGAGAGTDGPSSLRAAALLAAQLAFLAALVTTSLVESARIRNRPSRTIRCPTPALLLAVLAAGALAWELVLVPAHLRRGRAVVRSRRSGERVLEGARATDPDLGERARALRAGPAEVLAVPAAVAAGFVAPSGAMLLLGCPAAVAAWLAFPVWVMLVRVAVRAGVNAVVARRRTAAAAAAGGPEERDGGRRGVMEVPPVLLESSRGALLGVYAGPVLLSAAAHVFLLVSATMRDDRLEMTRAALHFILIHGLSIGLTVLYWLFVEAGWRVVVATVAAAAVLGPGAGVCIGWVYRERFVDMDESVRAVAVGGSREPSEHTPLLR
ncbi:hypothetical protein P8C59_004920 [Phyllachora maydis]|uniref:Uncharacterized protein n=1 Tax=Phyllachora maydis TaxID=1825666 RepID=A0AAD9I4N2_9PEZI|nr:hypothetical protein P8C59_004920 [Phyllachora maydis]